MRTKFLTILAVALMAAPAVGTAELVQAGVANILTFRDCISGESICDSFGPMEQATYGGVPGELAAEVSQADVAYGEAYGNAQLTGDPGAAELKAITTSTPATRNGSTSVMLQRYTNTSESAETLTFGATLAYEQTVPDENASFPDGESTRSGVSAEIAVFIMDDDSIEAGATAEDLYGALSWENEPAGFKDLGFTSVAPSDNETGEGEAPLSVTATVEPGDSIWLWAILQGIVVNGATVNASLTTSLQ